MTSQSSKNFPIDNKMKIHTKVSLLLAMNSKLGHPATAAAGGGGIPSEGSSTYVVVVEGR